MAITDNNGYVLSPLPVAPVNQTDMVLLPDGLKSSISRRLEKNFLMSNPYAAHSCFKKFHGNHCDGLFRTARLLRIIANK